MLEPSMRLDLCRLSDSNLYLLMCLKAAFLLPYLKYSIAFFLELHIRRCFCLVFFDYIFFISYLHVLKLLVEQLVC